MKPHPYHTGYPEFPIRLRPGVFMLGNYYFNLFLIIGSKKTILFETGVSAVVDAVIDQIETIGHPPDIIIPAHPHADHITGLPGLMDRFPHAQVVMAEGAKAFIEHPKAASGMIYEDRFISHRLSLLDIMPGRTSLQTVPDMSASRSAKDKTVYDTGGLHLELHRVKGHSPGNFVGVVPEEKIILCSDSLGFHFPDRGFVPLFFTGLDDYLDTMEWIRSLQPNMICPGHQGPIYKETLTRTLSRAFDDTRRLADRIIQTPVAEAAQLEQHLFEKYYVDEFTLYSPENIQNCVHLLIRRAKESNERAYQQKDSF